MKFESSEDASKIADVIAQDIGEQLHELEGDAGDQHVLSPELENFVYGVQDTKTGQYLGSFWRKVSDAKTHIGDQMHSTGDYRDTRWKIVELLEVDVPENCIIRGSIKK